MKRISLWALLAPLIVLASCSKIMNRSQSAILEFPEVSGETRLSAVKAANEKVESAVRDVEGYSREVNRPRISDVTEAFQNLRNTVNNIPGGRETPGDSSSLQIRSDAEKLRIVWDELYTGLQCGA